MCEALGTYLTTGDLAAALDFFDRNDDPNIEAEEGLNGRRAFRAALERLGVRVPSELA